MDKGLKSYICILSGRFRPPFLFTFSQLRGKLLDYSQHRGFQGDWTAIDVNISEKHCRVYNQSIFQVSITMSTFFLSNILKQHTDLCWLLLLATS